MTIKIEEQIKTIIELGQQNRFLDAEKMCNNVLSEYPNNPQVLTLLGLLKCQNNEKEEGYSLIKKALEIQPSSKLYCDLGRLYIENNDFLNAEPNCKRSIELDESNFDAWFYYGLSLKMNNKIDEAIAAYEKALDLNQNAASVLHNLGNIYTNIKNDPKTALIYYERYLECDPDNDDAKSCVGAMYLKLKNYEKGWEYLEYCMNKALAIAHRKSIDNSLTKSKPIWWGEDISDKTIYVYYDGGLGDVIMFARFLPMLKEKCKKVLFRSPSSMIKLFKDCQFDIEVLDKNFPESEIKFDYHLPLMSLAHRLNINTEDKIPFSEGFLKTDANKVQDYKRKYFDDDKFKIGIKWQGDTTYNQTRQFPLKSALKLMEIPNTNFYSLQKGSGIEQLEGVNGINGVRGYEIIDLGSTFEDFSDTAAAIENLDLVICNDTSVAHLAGAMGKKCWVVLPYAQDWRWSMDISYNPWYKSIKMFKQPELGDWDGVFKQVYQELEKIIRP